VLIKALRCAHDDTSRIAFTDLPGHSRTAGAERMQPAGPARNDSPYLPGRQKEGLAQEADLFRRFLTTP
jgi:hypothetical protein